MGRIFFPHRRTLCWGPPGIFRARRRIRLGHWVAHAKVKIPATEFDRGVFKFSCKLSIWFARSKLVRSCDCLSRHPDVWLRAPANNLLCRSNNSVMHSKFSVHWTTSLRCTQMMSKQMNYSRFLRFSHQIVELGDVNGFSHSRLECVRMLWLIIWI